MLHLEFLERLCVGMTAPSKLLGSLMTRGAGDHYFGFGREIRSGTDGGFKMKRTEAGGTVFGSKSVSGSI